MSGKGICNSQIRNVNEIFIKMQKADMIYINTISTIPLQINMLTCSAKLKSVYMSTQECYAIRPINSFPAQYALKSFILLLVVPLAPTGNIFK